MITITFQQLMLALVSASDALMLGMLTQDALSAVSLAGQITFVENLFFAAMAIGLSMLAAQYWGKGGRLDKAKEYGGRLCRMSVLCGVASGIVMLALSPLIFAVTDLSVTANTYLKWMFVMCSCYMFGKSVNGTTIGGIFYAGGDSRFSILCDTVTMCCITVPLGFLAAFVLQFPVVAVYFIVNLDEIVKLPAVYILCGHR